MTLRLALLSAAALWGQGAALRAAASPRAADGNEKQRRAKGRDLVLMHVPFNFGHTVESAALLPFMPNMREGMHGAQASKGAGLRVPKSLVAVSKMLRPNGVAWGHLNPDLGVVSEVTGCPMYYTPQKYWPKDLAKKYFGDKTIFGMLRDPYERLTAFFRGGMDTYGGAYPEFWDKCDVNGAVKKMMTEVLAAKNPFLHNCTFLPQADYFDGEYGIKLPIDNRRFPSSMNAVLKQHAYRFQIQTSKIIHVRGCDNVWAGDLDAETKALVKKVYARDFELLCTHFGYCDKEEIVCLPEVPYMCPLNHFKWDNKANCFKPIDTAKP